jgi:hypothetical protein
MSTIHRGPGSFHASVYGARQQAGLIQPHIGTAGELTGDGAHGHDDDDGSHEHPALSDRVDEHDGRLDEHDGRLERLEANLGAPLNPDQWDGEG